MELELPSQRNCFAFFFFLPQIFGILKQGLSNLRPYIRIVWKDNKKAVIMTTGLKI